MFIVLSIRAKNGCSWEVKKNIVRLGLFSVALTHVARVMHEA